VTPWQRAGSGARRHSRKHTLGTGVPDAAGRACKRTMTAKTLRYMWEVRMPLKMLSSSLILREFSILKICAVGTALRALKHDTVPLHQVQAQVVLKM